MHMQGGSKAQGNKENKSKNSKARGREKNQWKSNASLQKRKTTLKGSIISLELCSPLKPLQKTEKEQKQVQSLEELAVLAVPNPGEIARQFFSPWQTVRMALEEREYSEMQEQYRKKHAKKFRYVMKELKYVDDYNWTWSLFPSHVLLLLPSNFSVFL